MYKQCQGGCKCQAGCDQKAAEAKKKCGDDEACMKKVSAMYKECSIGCKDGKREMPVFMKEEKPSCGDMCDKKAADAKNKCGDDEACMKKVSAMYKECQGGCKCQAGCDQKAADAKKKCGGKPECMEKIT